MKLTSYFRTIVVLACVTALAVVASAQTTGTTGGTGNFDYTTALSGAQTNLTSVFSTNGAAILGILVVALGFGIVWRLLKRAAKSV